MTSATFRALLSAHRALIADTDSFMRPSSAGGDGGEAVEGRLHRQRSGVPQLLRSRESRLPGLHQKGVSEEDQDGIFTGVTVALTRILQPGDVK